MTAFTETAGADRLRAGISRQEEKRIALSLSPSIAWPTLALALALPSACSR